MFGGNRFPNMLIGSRAAKDRPRLVLTPRAPGFDDPGRPKIIVHFWSRGYLNPTTADRVTDGLPPEVETAVAPPARLQAQHLWPPQFPASNRPGRSM